MRILVTTGPTREYFDSVRFISNASSGLMGLSIAHVAQQRGHEVTVVAGPLSVAVPEQLAVTHVVSAAEMLQAAEEAFVHADAAILAAAVCDYRPGSRQWQKSPKRAGGLSLDLESTPDIAATLGQAKGGRILIGFAMEDHDHRRHAEAKLRRKHFDAIVLNAAATAGAQTATIELFAPSAGWSGPFGGSKPDAAARIVSLAEGLCGRADGG